MYIHVFTKYYIIMPVIELSKICDSAVTNLEGLANTIHKKNEIELRRISFIVKQSKELTTSSILNATATF